jgi:ABC-type glycerol-3-phosphate transport system substrate-binding protein
MKRIIAVVFVLSLAASMIQAAPVTIRYMGGYIMDPAVTKSGWDKIVYEWADKNKANVDLKLEFAPGDDLAVKLPAAMAAGMPPDVFNYWPNYGACGPFIESGLVLNVDDFFAKSTKTKKSDFYDFMWKVFSADKGKTCYGFATQGGYYYLLANRELFAKYKVSYPKTTDDLIKLAKVFNANGIIPLAVGSKGPNPAHFWMAATIHQYISNDEAEGIKFLETPFDRPEIRQALQVCADELKAGVFPKDVVAFDFGPCVAAYNEQKAAMVYTFAWMIPQFTDDIVKKSDVIEEPLAPGAKYPPGPKTWGSGSINHGWMISKKSFNDLSKQKYIVDFMDMLLSDRSLTALALVGHNHPKKTGHPPESQLPLLQQKLDKFFDSRPMRANFYWLVPNGADPFLNDNVDRFWGQDLSVDKFVKGLQDALNSLR